MVSNKNSELIHWQLAHERRMEDNPDWKAQPYWEQNCLNRPFYHHVCTIYNGTFLGCNEKIGIDIYCDHDDEGLVFLAVFGNTTCDVIQFTKGSKQFRTLMQFGLIASELKSIALTRPPEGEESDNTRKSKPKSKGVRTNSKAKSSNTTSKPKTDGQEPFSEI
jgi:hypothetical protein